MPKSKKLCVTSRCRNSRIERKLLCHACAKRKYRENNKMRAAYQNLKDHAKSRGKEFDITFTDFETFCVEVEYLKGKGRSSTSLHIDRIDETLGYVRGNLQVLTNAENTKKYLQYAWETKEARVVKKIPVKPHADDPF